MIRYNQNNWATMLTYWNAINHICIVILNAVSCTEGYDLTVLNNSIQFLLINYLNFCYALFRWIFFFWFVRYCSFYVYAVICRVSFTLFDVFTILTYFGSLSKWLLGWYVFGHFILYSIELTWLGCFFAAHHSIITEYFVLNIYILFWL